MNKLILVSGDGCASCVSMKEVVINVAQNLEIEYEIVEANQEIIDKYMINSVPTILLIHNNELVDKVKGFQPEEILQLWVSYKVEECNKKDYNVSI